MSHSVDVPVPRVVGPFDLMTTVSFFFLACAARARLGGGRQGWAFEGDVCTGGRRQGWAFERVMGGMVLVDGEGRDGWDTAELVWLD